MPDIKFSEAPVEPSALAKQITSDIKQIGLQLGKSMYSNETRDEPYDRAVRVMETLVAKDCYSLTNMPWLYEKPNNEED